MILSMSALLLAVLMLTAVTLVYNGIIKLNDPSRAQFPVRGIDVSSYQGEIDWAVIAEQGIDFAFIKATEGSGYQDPYFEQNYENAQKTDIRIGAYHFFSFDSVGATQAQNYIDTVERIDNMLPPVIDVELYGEYVKSPPTHLDGIREEMSVLVGWLTEHYGMTPIIYTTYESYELLISGYFDECDIWIRDILGYPELPDGRQWLFWQYSNRGRLDGYSGEERFIDLNVYRGSRESFELYAR